jgi:hypothetical protein
LCAVVEERLLELIAEIVGYDIPRDFSIDSLDVVEG